MSTATTNNEYECSNSVFSELTKPSTLTHRHGCDWTLTLPPLSILVNPTLCKISNWLLGKKIKSGTR